MQTKQIQWNDGSGDHLLLTYQGHGDSPVTVQSDANDGAARSQVVTIETTAGSPAVVKNFTVSQGACPVPVGTVLNYAYTGSYQEVELPAGQYKLQCWGAQGGSNAANSSYGITAQAGGKGGYSEGVLTLTSNTTVRIYVGGAGSSSAGGFNGGGSTTGSSSYNSGNEQGVSRMGGGGGATDIRLSDGQLLSRMIVAGGGSGGAMCYQAVTTTTTSWNTKGSYNMSNTNDNRGLLQTSQSANINLSAGDHVKVTDFASSYFDVSTVTISEMRFIYRSSSGSWLTHDVISMNSEYTVKSVSNTSWYQIQIIINKTDLSWENNIASFKIKIKVSSSSTSTNTSSQIGYAGGGTNGIGYSSSYYGKQSSAGSNGSFGLGANQSATNYRYASGAGGGGWYGGGGGQYSDSSMATCRCSGGGSGWVNIAANASYRPSGYTGLQLDSGKTKAGNTSFPSTSGGTETGHSGNGYAKITRLL